MKKSRRKWHAGRIFLVIVLVFAGLLVCSVLWNKVYSTKWENLGETEQGVLNELDVLFKGMEQEPLWAEYPLNEKGVVLIPKEHVYSSILGYAYAVNCEGLEGKLYAQEIELPEDSSLQSVYRLSIVTPKLLSVRVAMGNFIGIGKSLQLGESKQVYCIKYDREESLLKKNSSLHFAAFLGHEAFHYYMQNDWKIKDFYIEQASDKQIQLIKEEYAILDQVQQEMNQKQPDKGLLGKYMQDYVAVMDKRIEENPDYVEGETLKETAEGSSTYIGIKASQMVGYDFGIMYFDNRVAVPLGDVFAGIEGGHLEKRFLDGRGLYETGALLCMVMDQLDVENWQDKLNEQTLDKPETLYTLLKQYVETT